MFEPILYVTMTIEVNMWALALTTFGVVFLFFSLLKEIKFYKHAVHQWEFELAEP